MELIKLVKPKGHKVSSTWAMATAPQPGRLWPSRCLIWEAADPYLYLRTTLDGRVICGGEDEEFSDDARRDALIPKKIAAIARKLGKLMPNIDTEPKFAWAGCFGESATGLPAIGPIPDAARCLAVMGYGGNGITFSAIAAQIIQRAILGVADPDAEAQDFLDRLGDLDRFIGGNGSVNGDVTARSVSIEPGGELNGAMNIVRGKAPAPVPTPGA